MIAPSEFQDYLQKICHRYEQWWAVDALTETIADRQASFSFEQMVQTEEKKAGEKPQIVSLPILKGIQNYVESEHILLVGSPGVGKSTALLRCLVSFAKKELGKPEPRIPVLVPLKRYNIRFSSSEDPSGMLTLIRDALKPQLRLKISEVEELLFQKRLILLLDGLNEMPADTVRTQLKAFREECDEIPFICTTRDIGSGDLGIKRRLEAQPPNPLEINRFLRECMPAQAQQVLQLLSRDNRELSRTPFVLWMLYHLFQETDVVVETLGEAFRQFFRSFKKYKEDAPVTDERRKAWNPWLEHLAFTMLNSPELTDPGLVISDERAEKVLAEKFGDLHSASSRIEELLKYHLLERVSEKEVSFHHQLIQEYYAAECLLPQLSKLIKEQPGQKYSSFQIDYLNYLKWKEAIAIMLGLPEITENQAKQLINLALEVDLYLGARLAGEVKPMLQNQTIGLIIRLTIPKHLKVRLLGLTRSDVAIQFLEETLTNDFLEIGKLAVEALKRIGSECANLSLAQTLKHKDIDIDIRRAAANELREFAEKSAISTLLQTLLLDKSEDSTVRVHIAVALSKIGDKSVVPALLQIIFDEDEDTNVRMNVASSLKEISFEELIPHLQKALESENNSVSWVAANLLRDIGNNTAKNILRQSLLNDNPWTRIHSAFALASLEDKNYTIALIRAVESELLKIDLFGFTRYKLEFVNVLSNLVDTLGYTGDPEVVPILRNLSSHEDPNICTRAIKALGRVGKEGVIPLLTQIFRNKKQDNIHLPIIRGSAAEALGDTGCQEAIPILLEGLEEECPFVREAAVAGLGNFRSKKVIHVLVKALRDKSETVKERAAIAFDNIGSDIDSNCSEVIDGLIQSLEDSKPSIRFHAAQALWRIGSRNIPTSSILKALEDEVATVRMTAARVLGVIKSGSEPIICALLKALKEDADLGTRICAAEALGNLGNSELIPVFHKLQLENFESYIDAAIAAIQSHCQFYNYEIYQQAQEADNLGFEDDFIRIFYKDLDQVIYRIEENPELRQKDTEDRLTIDIVNQLRSLGYDAAHDSKIGGHADLAVRKSDFVWLGEAKIYTDNNYLWEGFQQLTTRYSIGDSNQRNGGLLIYLREGDASSIMKKWQNYLLEKSLPDYSYRPCKMRSLAFISTHRHERSGQAFHVRHIPVMLHFAPKDKSGRRRKESP